MGKFEVSEVPEYAVKLMYAYLFCYYTRIVDNVPGLNIVPWMGIMFLFVTIWGFTRFKVQYLSTPIGLILVLGILFALTGIGAVSVISYKMAFHWVFEKLPQCMALYVVFCGRDRLKSLLDLWCVIYFFMALFTIKNTPYGAGDFTRDPNDACMALAMGIPLVFYVSCLKSTGRKKRLCLYGVLGLLFVGIVMTGSRGGFLSLIGVLGVMWWLSRARLKIFLYSATLGLTIGGTVLLTVLPEGYFKEMESINNPEDGTRVERFRTWEIGWLMFLDKPLVGAGAGNFKHTSKAYQPLTTWWTGRQKSLAGRASHSLYFQVIPELGIVGIGLFLYIIFYLPFKLYLGRKQYAKDRETDEDAEILYMWSNWLIASMAAYAVAGAFISVAYYPHIPIWLTMYAIFLRHDSTYKEKTSNRTGRRSKRVVMASNDTEKEPLIHNGSHLKSRLT